MKLFKQNPGEHVEFILRRHPFTFVPSVLIFLATAVVPPVFLVIATDGPIRFSNAFVHAGAVLLAGVYYLGVWLFFFSQFTDYYLDISIVTNDRIIDIEQKGLFGRVISELDLSRIQDVNSEVKGIIPTMFGYGLVEIQTAAEEQHFEFEQVPNPHKVRQRIIELAALDRKREAQELQEQGAGPPQAPPPAGKAQGL